jgi:hypothetical protein
MNDVWERIPDNDFGSRIYNLIDPDTILPTKDKGTKLCNECENMNIWADHIAIEREMWSLRSKAARCKLCYLLLQTAEKNCWNSNEIFRLYRFGSGLHLETTGPAVLSICAGPCESEQPRRLSYANDLLKTEKAFHRQSVRAFLQYQLQEARMRYPY